MVTKDTPRPESLDKCGGPTHKNSRRFSASNNAAIGCNPNPSHRYGNRSGRNPGDCIRNHLPGYPGGDSESGAGSRLPSDISSNVADGGERRMGSRSRGCAPDCTAGYSAGCPADRPTNCSASSLPGGTPSRPGNHPPSDPLTQSRIDVNHLPLSDLRSIRRTHPRETDWSHAPIPAVSGSY